MKQFIKDLIERVKAGDRTTNKLVLILWIDELEKEVELNESCNLRTDESDEELRMLHDVKSKLKKRLLIQKEGD